MSTLVQCHFEVLTAIGCFNSILFSQCGICYRDECIIHDISAIAPGTILYLYAAVYLASCDILTQLLFQRLENFAFLNSL